VAIKLPTFMVTNVMIHKMPKIKVLDRDPAAFEASLAEAEVELNDDLRQFFRERITTSLAKQAFKAVYDSPAETPGSDEGDDDDETEKALPRLRSTVPQLVVDYFSDQRDLVDASRAIAIELYKQQTGGTSAGILVVIGGLVGLTGTSGSGRCLVLLKLEDDKALLVEPAKTADGKSTYAASLRDVTLPEEAEVFKAALFTKVLSLADIEATVSDHQRDANRYNKEISDFFLRFLGCRLVVSPDRATMDFMERAVGFANSVDDESTQAQYTDLFLTELRSASGVIKPREIADKLEPAHRDQFLSLFKTEDGSVPIITKDTSRVASRLDNVLYEFSDGIKLWGPRQAVSDHLQRRDGSDGWHLAAELRKAGPTGKR